MTKNPGSCLDGMQVGYVASDVESWTTSSKCMGDFGVFITIVSSENVPLRTNLMGIIESIENSYAA